MKTKHLLTNLLVLFCLLVVHTTAVGQIPNCNPSSITIHRFSPQTYSFNIYRGGSSGDFKVYSASGLAYQLPITGYRGSYNTADIDIGSYTEHTTTGFLSINTSEGTANVAVTVLGGAISSDQAVPAGGSVYIRSSEDVSGAGRYEWQYSSSKSGPWVNLSGASGSGTTVKPTGDTYYRRVAYDYRGQWAGYSNAYQLLVMNPGAITTFPMYTIKGTSFTLTNTGSSNGFLTWESSPNGTSSWTTVTNSGAATITTSVNVDTWFRCSTSRQNKYIYTQPVKVTVADPFVPGSISYTQSQTTINSSAPASGGLGTYNYQWQALSSGLWSNISGATGASYSPPEPSVTTSYRRAVSVSVFPSGTLYSNVVTINALSAGTISGGESTYAGYALSPLSNATSASGGYGTLTYLWEYNSGGGWVSTGNNGASYTPPAVNLTTSFRRKVSSASRAVYSNTVVVNIYSPLVAGTISGNTTIYSGYSASLSGGASSGGTGGYSYQWESSPNNSTWGSISGATAVSYTPGGIAQTTYYRRKTTSGSGASSVVYSNTVTVTVCPALVAGGISGNQTVYANSPVSALGGAASSGGMGGYSYQWESSLNNSTWSSISGATDVSYTPSGITQITYYRRRTTSGFGDYGVAYSNSVTVAVCPALVAGSVSAHQTIHAGEAPGALTCSVASGGMGGYVYQWESSPNNSTWTPIIGATSLSYAPGVLNAITYYHCKVTSSGRSVNSASICITVAQSLTAGSIATSTPVVRKNQSARIYNSSSPQGGTNERIYTWQQNISDPLNDSQWSNIAGANAADYTAYPTVKTSYRRIVKSWDLSAISNAVTISIAKPLDGGSISGMPISEGNQIIRINESYPATGGVGGYSYSWDYTTEKEYTKEGGYPLPIWVGVNATTKTLNRDDLQTDFFESMIFRRTVRNGDEEASSIGIVKVSGVQLTPDIIKINRFKSGSETVYFNKYPTSVKVESYLYDLPIISATLNGSSVIINYGIYTGYETEFYIYISFPGQNLPSSQLLVQIAGGRIADPPVPFQPDEPVVIESIKPDEHATSYQWQSSPSISGPWVDVSGQTSLGLSGVVIKADTYFRRAGASPSGTVYSNPVLAKLLSGGTISADVSKIHENNQVTLTSVGSTSGASTSWVQSIDGGTSWSSVQGAFGDKITVKINAVTQFRLKVTSGEMVAYSNTVTVNPCTDLTAGSISAPTTVDPGQPITFENVVPGDAADSHYSWYYGYPVQGIVSQWNLISGADGASYTAPSGITQTTAFVRRISKTATEYKETDIITITVREVLKSGEITGSQTINTGNTPTPLMSKTSATGGDPASYVYTWQQSPDGTTWSDIAASNAATYTPSPLSATTQFRRQVTSHTQSATTTPVTVTVKSGELIATAGRNYIMRRVPLSAATTLSAKISDHRQATVTYYDGLGRPQQQVAVGEAGTSGLDLVRPISYDIHGRADSVDYLPYKTTVSGGAYAENATLRQSEFYNTLYSGHGNFASLRRVYEPSTAGRLLKMHNVGSEYSVDAKAFSVSASPADIRRYTVSAAGELVASGTYPAAALSATLTTDEDGKQTSEFRDLSGRLILSRSILQAAQYSDTHYVYDNMGRLSYVLSPEATDAMKNAVNAQTISDLCYTYTYDSRGRLATKRLPGSADQWLVYDSGDRLAMSSDGNLRAAGQWIYYQYDALGRIAEQGRFAASYATQSAAQQAFNGTFSGSAFDIKYQYDSYTGVPAALAISGAANDLRVKGLKTYESIRVLNPAAGEPQTIDRAFYYDAKGRVVQIVATNVKGGVDRTTMTYNWAGDLLTTTETHSYSGGSNTLATTATYDRTGKPLTQSVAADGSVTASNTFTYDDLNRTAGKTYGSLSETLSYNVQGWLTGISSSKFTQTLTYFPTYKNGNIASTQWTQAGSNSNGYSFNYDQLNRLTAATGNAFTEQGITYDKNGNIKSLQRTANNLTIENLSYVYSGNKLTSVNESVTGGMTSSYTYDANGNLAADSKKALNFSYNFLNLVQAAGTTNYCYAADGTKLAVRDNSGNGFAYLGSLILSPSSTEFQFSDGVIRKTTSGYEVNYFLRDHLGSVRTVVNAAGEVVQQSDYYPFGSKHENATYANNSNRFLYNGKELQTTGNLGFLDYGARMYDAKLGRWFVQDNLAEKYTAFSPYNYVLNNPIKYIDPDGTKVRFAQGVSQEFKNQFAKTVQYMNKKGTSGKLAQLEKSETVYYIGEPTNQRKNKGSYFRTIDRTIYWNSREAYQTSLTETSIIIISPATILAHELDHALQFDENQGQQERDARREDKEYKNLEEKRVITGFEQEVATKHGEINNGEVTRTNHRVIQTLKVPYADPEKIEEFIRSQKELFKQ